MVRTIIVYDDQDVVLGEFFNDCKNDIDAFFVLNNLTYSSLRSAQLNDLSISLITENLPSFIFGAYSHGGNDHLIGTQGQYVSTTVNQTCFKNSFFYTCSCLTGKTLGEKLIEEGCHSFIGYKNKFTVWDFNRPPFIDCANYGLKLFLSGVNTQEIIIEMKRKYDFHIDNYNNDIFGAAMLVSNKKALISHGNSINIGNL